MHHLAQKCIQLMPSSGTNGLTGLIIGVMSENPEVRAWSRPLSVSLDFLYILIYCFYNIFSMIRLSWQNAQKILALGKSNNLLISIHWSTVLTDFGICTCRLVTHAMELLTADNDYADIMLHEERPNLGGISIEELHRLVYAQVLCCHPLTWQVSYVT
jgi:nuclear pore complex protein Nup85